jgi:hypothetical protein
VYADGDLEELKKMLRIIIIIIIIIIRLLLLLLLLLLLSLVTGPFFLVLSVLKSGDPHRSGFKFQTAISFHV